MIPCSSPAPCPQMPAGPPPLSQDRPARFRPLPGAGCFGGRLILPFGMSHHHPPPPRAVPRSRPTSPAWLCHPQTLPKPLSPQEGQRGDPPPAATRRPRHQPGRDLSLTRPEEFLGRGASPGSARSSPDTTLGQSKPSWWLVPTVPCLPTAGISAANPE